MTTREAFDKMINTKGVHKQLGITAEQIAVIRYDYRRGSVSLERMEDLLIKVGWQKIPEAWIKR